VKTFVFDNQPCLMNHLSSCCEARLKLADQQTLKHVFSIYLYIHGSLMEVRDRAIKISYS